MLNDWNKLISEEELATESTYRKKKEVEEKVSWDEVKERENDDWIIKKQYKNGTASMTKQKDSNELLIDELWTIFYKMGFKYMNPSGNFIVNVKNQYIDLQKKIDVVAIDDETCLFVDCYSSKELDRTRNFEDEISEINRSFKQLSNEIREKYGDKKCKYIFVATNYLLSENNINLLKNNKIVYFSEEDVDYYKALVDHLGGASRYQLLGNLFRKTEIKGMDERVPAIEGKMGGLTYYSFLIEPERLLKIGYVLHRNKANHDQMPTYQRLIKKERLKAIRAFVDNGGYFPNSLIISIDASDGKLRFDKAPQAMQDAHSRVGTLYLPKEYQSAYIIDGQHRLYGYSDSKFASRDTLPVIAFVNLEKEMQVKMFMDINENQKPVSKTLRNILNIDLNWNSDNLNKRKEAIILNVCQSLGENPNSPLYGRVLTGEDTINEKRCITIEYLKTAIEKTNLLNKYNKKNEVTERGLIDFLDSEKTYDSLYNYLRNCLQVISDLCQEEWNKGSSGFLTINNTMVGVIRIIADITNITFFENDMDVNNIDIEKLYKGSEELLINFTETLNNLPLEKRNDIKTAKGGMAKDFAWRTLQVAFNNYDSKFINPELAKYIEENCNDFNVDGYNEILYIKEKILKNLKEKITTYLDWENMYFPEELSVQLNQRIAAQNVRNNRAGNDEKVELWDVLEILDICKICNYKSNWSTFMKDILTNDEQKTRAEIVAVLKSIDALEKRINNGKHITKTEYLTINSFYNDLKGE